MGWREFIGWLEVLDRQNKPPEVDPGSWQGADQDPWWQQARRERDEMRAR